MEGMMLILVAAHQNIQAVFCRLLAELDRTDIVMTGCDLPETFDLLTDTPEFIFVSIVPDDDDRIALFRRLLAVAPAGGTIFGMGFSEASDFDDDIAQHYIQLPLTAQAFALLIEKV
jgi:hypothetical protein